MVTATRPSAIVFLKTLRARGGTTSPLFRKRITATAHTTALRSE